MITYDALLRYAKTLEGEVLETSARHKKFTVEVTKNGLAYTPESKKKRPNPKKYIEDVLVRFNETKSFSPGHYGDLTRQSSYLMRIIEMMVSEENRRDE